MIYAMHGYFTKTYALFFIATKMAVYKDPLEQDFNISRDSEYYAAIKQA